MTYVVLQLLTSTRIFIPAAVEVEVDSTNLEIGVVSPMVHTGSTGIIFCIPKGQLLNQLFIKLLGCFNRLPVVCYVFKIYASSQQPPV